MRNLSRILILSSLFFLVLPANADQSAGDSSRIFGKILNMAGSPLADAVIRIFREIEEGESIVVARSDERGIFKSSNLQPGVYYLQVLQKGFKPVKTNKFIVDAGRTTSLNIVLQELVGAISRDSDPRNWDMDTVLRSTSDRRFIFRNRNEADLSINGIASAFERSGAMNIASGANDVYLFPTQINQAGVSSNFGYTEPVSTHSRMILSGQLDYGDGSFWRLRNTYNYRPDRDHDYKVSIGYGRLSTFAGSQIDAQPLYSDTNPLTSGIRTLAFGIEGSNNFLDLMTVRYGFDYSRLDYGSSRSFYYPSIQIVVHPFAGWSVLTSMSSRKLSDINSIALPDGEIVNFSEPTLITLFDSHISMSQITHSEAAAQKTIGKDSLIELACYQDRTQGPGLPIKITMITSRERSSRIIEMREDHSRQRGLRMTIKRKIGNNINGSISYVYGNSIGIASISEPVSMDTIDSAIGNYMQQTNQHSITGRVDAAIPITKTRILAALRWYSKNSLTPADWFSDRMDIGSKSANLEVRQVIPFPEFMGAIGRWEILLDMRNLLNQGQKFLPISDGELALNRNPRSMRFGLNLSFR